MKLNSILFAIALLFSLTACKAQPSASESAPVKKSNKDLSGLSKAYFASGCFWCVEAVFESVEGVEEAISGYAGGKAGTATYSKVSSGNTLHAEAVEVFYDPEVVSYETLLEVFFGSHDPTTLNRQGPDRGPQYRSEIFYQTPEEKAAANTYIKESTQKNEFGSPITTKVSKLIEFYPAEEYHQDFERRNPNQGYVQAVSVPRLKKFQAKFPELLKKKH